MRDPWVCGDCRTVNMARQTRCYNCHVLRTAGEMTQSAAMVASSARRERRTLHETADRMGARYRPSWPIAILLPPLIMVALALQIAAARAVGDLVDANGQQIDDPRAADRLYTLLGWSSIAFLAGLLAWSVWIALVARNIPALTARWAPNSPIGAFLAVWIPIINFKRPYSVVRGVLLLLAPGRVVPQLMALAWWLFLLGTFVGPTIFVVASGDRFATILAAAVAAGQLRVALLVPAGILAVTLVTVIERAQHLALRDRDLVAPGVGSESRP